MAMIDYGAVVKKNGKLLPYNNHFNNYSTLSGGVLHEEYEDILFEGDDEPTHTLTVHEYVGDESVRTSFDGEKRSVIGNYMAVVGDEDYLIGTYKNGLVVFDNEKYIADYMIGQDDTWWDPKDDMNPFYIQHRKIVKYLDTPFGTIKIKRLSPSEFVGVASFRYKDDNYEILFGYGVDCKEFIFSKGAENYFKAKTLRKVRRWFLR